MPTNNLVIISDTHSGCRVALCPRHGVDLDDGGHYRPSSMQSKLYDMWEYFWNVWVPDATRGEPFDLVMNGDALNGTPHQSKTNISNNWADQHKIYEDLIKPILDNPLCEKYYHIRGTEAHVGKSAEQEEILARNLGAVVNEQGMSARYEVWKNVGDHLVHALHHVGTTGSNAYESSAVHKELVETLTESARWSQPIPHVIARAHRHRCIETNIPAGVPLPDGSMKTFDVRAVVTPSWQGKTPFVWKIPGGRLTTPQFGGIVIRESEGELFIRKKVWTVPRSRVEE